MPLASDPERPGGRRLSAADGTPIARFLREERDGRPVADLLELEPGIDEARAVPAILAELGGWRVAGRAPLGAALVAAGGQPRREAHVMSRDLVGDPAGAAWLAPPAPAGLRLVPAERPAAELVAACLAAYPPGHPDHPGVRDPDHPELELESVLSGRLMGPLLPASGLAVDAHGTVRAGVLVNATPGEPPFGGPWISQLFRDPGAPGAGRALLRRALALATRDGLPALGLAVTHGNPALELYAAHGFRDVLHSLSVDIRTHGDPA